jgi:hypothetical protein|tara:strand:+ start:189 stop:365 length:177 start_codon:yes stop_codon:yes gene_type:complete
LLRSLFERPRKALLDDIIQEARDAHSYHRASAIFALGAYPDKKVMISKVYDIELTQYH